MTVGQALNILYAFLITAAFLIVLIIIQKASHIGESRRQRLARDLFYKLYYDGEEAKLPLFIRPFFDVLMDIETQIVIEPEVRTRVIADLSKRWFVKRQYACLRNLFPKTREVAASYLGALKTPKAINALRKQLHQEPLSPFRSASDAVFG